jgi:hypothetical protein
MHHEPILLLIRKNPCNCYTSVMFCISNILLTTDIFYPHRPYYKALVRISAHSSYKVRNQGRASIRRIYSAPGGSSLALPMLQQFSLLLQNQAVIIFPDF